MLRRKYRQTIRKKQQKTITYKLKFIDSYRSMESKLSDLVDNLSEINEKECPKYIGKNKLNRNAIIQGLDIID